MRIFANRRHVKATAVVAVALAPVLGLIFMRGLSQHGATRAATDAVLDQPTAAPDRTAEPGRNPAEPAASSQTAPVAECLRYSEQGWRGYGSTLPLGACVRVMYQGQCARPGEANYGRWGGQTLRLIPGRVEISDDNKHFRPLVEQNPADCSIAAM